MSEQRPATVGTVVCPPGRPATASEAWVVLSDPDSVAINDLLLIDGEHQQILGSVVDMQVVDSAFEAAQANRTYYARLNLLGSSDMRRRPPDGTTVRLPDANEVSVLLTEARQIPLDQRIPFGVVPIQQHFAPVYVNLNRLAGPIATSALLTGAAGSLKSTAGLLLLLGVQQRLSPEGCALVLVNSKGEDYLFADLARDRWASRLGLRELSAGDRAMYTALGYPEPPVLQNARVFVPDTGGREPSWHSVRPSAFARTGTYKLSHAAGLRYAFAPTDDDEKATSVVTRQCMAEVSGPFARERGLHDLVSITNALEAEFFALGERQRWRSQFTTNSVAAALRQFRTVVRDLGPILEDEGVDVALPVEQLSKGGAWIIDVAPLPQRAAQAVLDHVVSELVRAKAQEIIPLEMPVLLLVDELNQWSQSGPTAARLSSIVREYRHRHFGIIALAQQASLLNPQLLANVDTISLGATRASELAQEFYAHLSDHIRSQLHRLPPGHRMLDAWPLREPIQIVLPFPSVLVGNEGRRVVEFWRQQRR